MKKDLADAWGIPIDQVEAMEQQAAAQTGGPATEPPPAPEAQPEQPKVQTRFGPEPKPAAPGELAKKEFTYQPLMKVGGMAGLKGLLQANMARIASQLPKHLTPERMFKAAYMAVSRTPKLLECTQESLVKSMLDASSLGLDCSGLLGAGYLIPFNNKIKLPNGATTWALEAQFMPGYRGLIDLARRSNQISNIDAQMVYEQDKFKLVLGTEPQIIHEPYLDADRKEVYRCVYGVGVLVGGAKQIQVMTMAEVEAIRKRSKTYNATTGRSSGPWATDYAEMAKKTVIRRLVKYLPMSTELEKALEIDNQAGEFDFDAYDAKVEIVEGLKALPNGSRTAGLAEKLKGGTNGTGQDQSDQG